jgi:hypothetical protein
MAHQNRICLALAALAAALLFGGCFVDGLCSVDDECEGAKICKDYRCVLDCTGDEDCPAGIPHRCATRPTGKRQCLLDLAKRVAAPDFCLQVVNPRSQYHGKDLCLSQLRGKVVMLYFAQLF